jgi:hypothetical protein
MKLFLVGVYYDVDSPGIGIEYGVLVAAKTPEQAKEIVLRNGHCITVEPVEIDIAKIRRMRKARIVE